MLQQQQPKILNKMFEDFVSSRQSFPSLQVKRNQITLMR